MYAFGSGNWRRSVTFGYFRENVYFSLVQKLNTVTEKVRHITLYIRKIVWPCELRYCIGLIEAAILEGVPCHVTVNRDGFKCKQYQPSDTKQWRIQGGGV